MQSDNTKRYSAAGRIKLIDAIHTGQRGLTVWKRLSFCLQFWTVGLRRVFSMNSNSTVPICSLRQAIPVQTLADNQAINKSRWSQSFALLNASQCSSDISLQNTFTMVRCQVRVTFTERSTVVVPPDGSVNNSLSIVRCRVHYDYENIFCTSCVLLLILDRLWQHAPEPLCPKVITTFALHYYCNCRSVGNFKGLKHQRAFLTLCFSLKVNRTRRRTYFFYSMALVRERTIQTERLPLVGEVSTTLYDS
jgi:hypothetical protein